MSHAINHLPPINSLAAAFCTRWNVWFRPKCSPHIKHIAKSQSWRYQDTTVTRLFKYGCILHPWQSYLACSLKRHCSFAVNYSGYLPNVPHWFKNIWLDHHAQMNQPLPPGALEMLWTTTPLSPSQHTYAGLDKLLVNVICNIALCFCSSRKRAFLFQSFHFHEIAWQFHTLPFSSSSRNSA